MECAGLLRPAPGLQRRLQGRWAHRAAPAGARGRGQQARRGRVVVPSVISRQQPSHRASHSETAIIIPLNYAQLLGLRGREMYLEPQVGAAYEELFHDPLEEGYSNVAKLGRDKLLYAAREGLRGVRGRVSLVPAETSIEPVLLAGAMALLEQVGEYQLVLDLAEQAQHLGAAALRSSNKETLRDFERDCVLASALAHCGLAREALDGGQAGPGCAHMEEALRLLRSVGPAPGALPLLGGAAGPPLAPKLQADISEALLEMRADLLLHYLQEAPSSEQALARRRQAVGHLRSMVSAPLPAEAAGENGAPPPAPGEYLRRAVPLLTSTETCDLLDWERVAASKAAFGWYYPGLLEAAAVAHIVAGFAQRRPALVETAVKLLQAVRLESDVAVELAVCEVLLGSPDLALAMLQEDERIGAALRGQPGGVPAPPVAVASPREDFPSRDGVMAFIRAQSPEGERDLLPGLCLFVEKWLQRIAFPRLRDTAQLPPNASLVAYFQDPHTEAYLARRDVDVGLLEQLARKTVSGSKVALAALVGLLSLPARAVHHLRLMGMLQSLQWLAGAMLLGALAGAAYQGVGGRRGMQEMMGRMPQVATPLNLWPRQAARPAAAQQAAAVEQQQQQVVLQKPAAEQVVKQWLRTKAEAMGPRHNTDPLPAVLAEPMLGQVAAEVAEAQQAGWFWTIRPLGARVDSIDSSNLGPDGSGYAVVLATVDESADLWATNGKKGDSYKTTYKVEYTVVQQQGAWKIATALVLGK